MRPFVLACTLLACSAVVVTAEDFQGLEGEAAPLPRTNGVIRELLLPEGVRWEVDGVNVPRAKGVAALVGDDQVPDDSKLPSLTFIGFHDEAKGLRKRLESNPETAELLRRFVVQDFSPANPLISKAGFACKGKPTIYAEMPDGRVLFRLDEYPGDKDFIHTVHQALLVAEGLRKPNDGYRPVSDPGIVLPIKPHVDAEISPSPWVLMLTHTAAFVAGMAVIGAAFFFGRLLLAAMVQGAVAQAVEKLKAKEPTD